MKSRMSSEEFLQWALNREKDVWGVSNKSKRQSHPEHELQVACVNEFRYLHPKLAKLLFAIPNGGKRYMKEAKELKAEGVIAGVPDLFLAVPKGGYHGLFIEMKNGNSNDTSKKQEEMIALLRSQGYRCEVVRSSEQFSLLIKEYCSK